MRKLFLMALSCLAVASASAQFSGYFAPHNWTTTTTGAAATAIIDTTEAPDSLFFYGPNDLSETAGNLTYSIVMPASGTLSFGFIVTSNDTGAVSDPYEYFLWTHDSDTLSILTDTTSGITNFAVDSGAVFTFSINSSLNTGGNIEAKVFDWVFTLTAPLPVEASPLTARLINDKVNISWETQSESGNSGFQLERSFDGRNFESIGFVPTKAEGGNSTSRIAYSFSDQPANATNAYYRYKQIDIDGAFVYSNVASVFLGGIVTPGFSLYPNPAATGSAITLNNEAAGTVVISDMMGKVALTQKVDEANAQLALAQLPAGTYIVSFSANSGQGSSSQLVVR